MSPFSQRSANISVHSVLVQVLLCLVFNLNGTNAKIPGGFTDIHRLHIVQNGGVIYLGSYGFNEHGVCTVHIKQNGPVPNFDTNTDRNVGFFLKKVQNVNEARMERWLSQQSICPDVLYSQGGRKLTLVGLNETDHYAASADISTPGFYALYFFNCETNAVNLSATVIRYNQVRDRVSGKLVTRYLQVGDGPKPVVYALFLVAQIAMLISWSYLLIRANRENRYRIHFVMSMLLFLYSMCLVIDLYKYIQFDRTGKTSEVIHGFYGVFLILRGCIWVCVLVLLGTGWSTLKPYLGDREKKGIVVILVLQLIANIAQVVMEELSEGDRSWIQWRDTLRIFDLLCCCGVLVPLVWSIRQLKESTQRDGKVLANIIRLQQFRSLYITFVVYIYYSRIVVMVINDALDFRSIWISTLLQELGTTVFFMYVGWRFQPGRHNPYLSLDLNILQAADMHNDLGVGNVKEFSNEPHESSFQEVVCVPSSLATQQDAKKTQSE